MNSFVLAFAKEENLSIVGGNWWSPSNICRFSFDFKFRKWIKIHILNVNLPNFNCTPI